MADNMKKMIINKKQKGFTGFDILVMFVTFIMLPFAFGVYSGAYNLFPELTELFK